MQACYLKSPTSYQFNKFGNNFVFAQDDDLIATVEESALLQRKYEKYLDMVIINDDFDITFRKVIETLDALSHEHQWVPVNWIY